MDHTKINLLVKLQHLDNQIESIVSLQKGLPEEIIALDEDLTFTNRQIESRKKIANDHLKLRQRLHGTATPVPAAVGAADLALSGGLDEGLDRPAARPPVEVVQRAQRQLVESPVLGALVERGLQRATLERYRVGAIALPPTSAGYDAARATGTAWPHTRVRVCKC